MVTKLHHSVLQKDYDKVYNPLEEFIRVACISKTLVIIGKKG